MAESGSEGYQPPVNLNKQVEQKNQAQPNLPSFKPKTVGNNQFDFNDKNKFADPNKSWDLETGIIRNSRGDIIHYGIPASAEVRKALTGVPPSLEELNQKLQKRENWQPEATRSILETLKNNTEKPVNDLSEFTDVVEGIGKEILTRAGWRFPEPSPELHPKD